MTALEKKLKQWMVLIVAKKFRDILVIATYSALQKLAKNAGTTFF